MPKIRPGIEAWVENASEEQRILLDEFICVMDGQADSGSIHMVLDACVKASSPSYVREVLRKVGEL